MLLDNKILVSLVIPVYNAEKYLIRCLESIQNQSYSCWETILVDDCSTDSSLNICQSFASKDTRFKIVQTPKNLGAGDARWLGVQNTKGDFIGFVDSDDWLSRNFLLFLLQLQNETNADIVSCQALHCQKGGYTFVNFPINMRRVFSPKEALILLDAENILYPVLWDKLYKKDIVLSEKIQTRACEDGYALVKYIQNAHKIAFTGLPLYYYNKFENSLSGSVSFLEHYKFYCYLAQVLKKEFYYLSPHIIKTGLRHVDRVCCFKTRKAIKAYFMNRFVEQIRALGVMKLSISDRFRCYILLKYPNLYMKFEQINMRLFHKRKYKECIKMGWGETNNLLKDIIQKINKTETLSENETFDNHNLFE